LQDAVPLQTLLASWLDLQCAGPVRGKPLVVSSKAARSSIFPVVFPQIWLPDGSGVLAAAWQGGLLRAIQGQEER